MGGHDLSQKKLITIIPNCQIAKRQISDALISVLATVQAQFSANERSVVPSRFEMTWTLKLSMCLCALVIGQSGKIPHKCPSPYASKFITVKLERPLSRCSRIAHVLFFLNMGIEFAGLTEGRQLHQAPAGTGHLLCVLSSLHVVCSRSSQVPRQCNDSHFVAVTNLKEATDSVAYHGPCCISTMVRVIFLTMITSSIL